MDVFKLNFQLDFDKSKMQFSSWIVRIIYTLLYKNPKVQYTSGTNSTFTDKKIDFTEIWFHYNQIK